MEKNRTNDMTTGNPIKLIIMFMIPMFLGNIFQQFYNIVDYCRRTVYRCRCTCGDRKYRFADVLRDRMAEWSQQRIWDYCGTDVWS